MKNVNNKRFFRKKKSNIEDKYKYPVEYISEDKDGALSLRIGKIIEEDIKLQTFKIKTGNKIYEVPFHRVGRVIKE